MSPTQVAEAALAAKFTAHELPATFVQDLAEDRATIDAAQDAEQTRTPRAWKAPPPLAA